MDSFKFYMVIKWFWLWELVAVETGSRPALCQEDKGSLSAPAQRWLCANHPSADAEPDKPALHFLTVCLHTHARSSFCHPLPASAVKSMRGKKRRSVFAVSLTWGCLYVCSLMCECESILQLWVCMCTLNACPRFQPVGGLLMEDAVKWFWRLRWRLRGRKKDGCPQGALIVPNSFSAL